MLRKWGELFVYRIIEADFTSNHCTLCDQMRRSIYPLAFITHTCIYVLVSDSDSSCQIEDALDEKANASLNETT